MSATPDSVRIGNGAGFWGDNLDAPIRLARDGDLDFLTLEYLAELTLSMLAHQRRRNPESGYVPDFPATVTRLLPILRDERKLRIVTNAGGLNPEACARETARILAAAGLGEIKVAWVGGDDLLPRMAELKAAGEGFRHFDSGAEFRAGGFVSVNAYLGAKPIATALDQGARIVITGRVADASLTVGPVMHAFRWGWTDWDRLAAASVAGHLIECGAQVTGGLLTRWQGVDYSDIGYPIAALSKSGECLITKPKGSGGVVNRETVTEQLLYEIGDPKAYHTPDVTLDFSEVEIEDKGDDVVRVNGARGLPPPPTLKVSCAFENGFMARGDLVVCGRDAAAKARLCGELILERTKHAGYSLEASEIEVIGAGAALPGAAIDAEALREVALRVSVRDKDEKAVARFCREISPIITSGPPGVTGYAGSRPRPKQVLSYWPTTVARERVRAKVETRTAAEWAS